MNIETPSAPSLDTIKVDRRLLDELFAAGIITPQARTYAVDLIYPTKNWGLWVSRLFLALGVSLILSGIIYFFAFNWTKIPPEAKLTAIQVALAGCLGASYYYGLQRLAGKTLLLSAFVLVGVFMAVFGQIYQTGADAYNLFLLWALLTLPWVLIAEFAPLWALWICVGNVFLITFRAQAFPPSADIDINLYACLAIFNGLFLIIREILAAAKYTWAAEGWTRHILLAQVLFCILTPTVIFIFDTGGMNEHKFAVALLSVVIHGASLYVYRYVLPSVMALVSVVTSISIIAESIAFNVLLRNLSYMDAALYLTMGIITLVVFALVVITLRAAATKMEVRNV